MPPCVACGVDPELLRAAWMLRDDDLGAAIVQLGHKSVAVERFTLNPHQQMLGPNS
jgi:hypothetical protein